MAPPEPSGAPPETPPVAAAQPRRPGRTGLIWAAIALALVLVITLVWALGGFAYRGDRIAPVAPGTTLEVGPYEFTFTSATVQQVSAADDYEVVVLGTGRTTKDKTIAPETGESGFIVAKNPANGEVQTVDSFHYGDGTDVTLRADSFTPGLDSIAFTATFKYTQPVSGELRLVVFDQKFFDDFVFGDDEPTWNRVDTGYSMTLPVKMLPARDY